MTERVTPVVFCIDVEPDARQVGRDAPDWLGVDATVAIVDRWRARLGDATGHDARFSWFWRADPQIADVYGDPAWGLRRYRETFEDTASKGDAHGVHPHTWRRLPSTDDWIQDHADASWVERCIDMSLTTFREEAGYRCVITRLGDRALNCVGYRRLAHHGVRVDLSVEPGEPPSRHETTAPSPDFAAAPTRPYRPRRDDVARPRRVARGPVLMPLSATVGEAPGGGDMRLRTVYPWLSTAPALAGGLLDRGAPYLAFAVRSDIGVSPELLPPFEALLAMLADGERAPSLRFVTPLEGLTALRRRVASRS